MNSRTRYTQVARRATAAVLLLFGFTMVFPSVALAADPPKPRPARLKISGYGLLGDRRLKRILTTVELGGKKPDFFHPSFVEDSALILMSRINEDGYLEPGIDITLRLAGGGILRTSAAELADNPLPRPLRIIEARFQITKGPLFYYERLDFEGLETIPEKQALSYFIQNEPLLRLKRTRVYTPQNLLRGMDSVRDVLARQGYASAAVDTASLRRDNRTGAVSARIKVVQGPKFMVRSVRQEFFYEGRPGPEELSTVHIDKPYSRIWEQDYVLALKTNQFKRGYADTRVELQRLGDEPERAGSLTNIIQRDFAAQIHSGPQIRVAATRFRGQKRTQEGFLSRRVRIQRGELLNPIRVENARFRLARLGVFDSVSVDYAPADENSRDVLFNLHEGKTREISLLLGWGSYELLRGGFIADLYNIWGLAHHARLKVVQSFKASSGEFTYTIPDVAVRDFDLFVNGSALRREEVSFTREEYGGGIGVHKFFHPLATDASLRYNYQILNAASIVPAVATEGLTNATVGSFTADLRYDRRDNPLYPRKGFNLFLTVESASDYFGGDANYERVEVSSSWHARLGGGRTFGVGFSHGAAISFGSPANNLPFNRRFFPGGANSIRGYQDGEASPRNDAGQLVGAESYMLGSVEIEQALTPKWSLVAFVDSLGYARHIENYPFDHGLFSAGGGIRWRTLIGPVRLEYGHNLNPRPGDPSGTIQFSLGFPF